jgi:hypothetical protein
MSKPMSDPHLAEVFPSVGKFVLFLANMHERWHLGKFILDLQDRCYHRATPQDASRGCREADDG